MNINPPPAINQTQVGVSTGVNPPVGVDGKGLGNKYRAPPVLELPTNTDLHGECY
jgi:hypothetical protein